VADLDRARIALARAASFVLAHATRGHSPHCAGALSTGGCPEGRRCEVRRLLAEIEAAVGGLAPKGDRCG
jgi:hypothetical protein